MTHKENITAILECYFTGFKKEIIDSACNRILEQEPKFVAKADGTIEQIKNCDDCLFKKEWEKIGKLISVILEKQTKQEPKTDVLDKIRAEIEAKCCITVGRENDAAITLHDVFEIIDKYKAETE